MEPVPINPRMKREIRELLSVFLFRKARLKYIERMEKIVAANSQAQNSPFQALYYNGGMYGPDADLVSIRQATRLAPSMQPAMSAFQTDFQHHLRIEVPLTEGAISQILNAVTDPRDSILFFPQFVHKQLMDELGEFFAGYVTALTPDQLSVLQERLLPSANKIRERLVYNLLL